jgi:surface polysaccharide O-acyltransferase-like enzyme
MQPGGAASTNTLEVRSMKKSTIYMAIVCLLFVVIYAFNGGLRFGVPLFVVGIAGDLYLEDRERHGK